MSIYTPRSATKKEAEKLRAYGFFGWDNARGGLHANWCHDEIDGVFTTGMALAEIRAENVSVALRVDAHSPPAVTHE